MWWLNRFFALAGSCLILASCGFEPLYGAQHNSAGGGNSPLASISIDPIDGLVGQQFHAALEDRFNPTGAPVNPQYRLAIILKPTKTPTVIEPDGTISRYNLQLESSYALYRASDGEKLRDGRIRRIASYNLADADFSDFIAENDAMRRALTEMAEDYRMRFAGFFKTGAIRYLTEEPAQ